MRCLQSSCQAKEQEEDKLVFRNQAPEAPGWAQEALSWESLGLCTSVAHGRDPGKGVSDTKRDFRSGHWWVAPLEPPACPQEELDVTPAFPESHRPQEEDKAREQGWRSLWPPSVLSPRSSGGWTLRAAGDPCEIATPHGNSGLGKKMPPTSGKQEAVLRGPGSKTGGAIENRSPSPSRCHCRAHCGQRHIPRGQSSRPRPVTSPGP